jgi:hypothetical protein
MSNETEKNVCTFIRKRRNIQLRKTDRDDEQQSTNEQEVEFKLIFFQFYFIRKH